MALKRDPSGVATIADEDNTEAKREVTENYGMNGVMKTIDLVEDVYKFDRLGWI